MGEVIVYMTIFTIIAVIGISHFKKQKNKKDLLTYLAIMLVNALLLVAYYLEMDLKPLDLIIFIYQPLSDFVYGFINLF